MDKTCTKCRQSRPIEEFNKSGKYRRSECQDCTRAASRAYGTANRARRNERLRAWRAANPDMARAKDRRARLMTKYGLTEEALLALLGRFDGKCWLCRKRPAVCVDHDHKTGIVRGVTCHGCNSWVLGRCDADPDYITRLVAYLGRLTHERGRTR